MSRERGILFSGPMVRAILDGTKTQTRRGMRLPAGSEGLKLTLREICEYPADRGGGLRAIFDTQEEPFSVRCPYGAPGDRLWVRETYLVDNFQHDELGARKRANADRELRDEFLREIYYRADGECCDQIAECGCEGRPGWTPSIHMPRWASRITLEITEVRVQRLHDISEADIRAEGVTADDRLWLPSERDDGDREDPREVGYETRRPGAWARDNWMRLWTSINGAESWDANPWLWCLTFKRVQP